MSAALTPCPRDAILHFPADDLPEFQYKDTWGTTSAQIAAYLRRLLEDYQTADIAHLELPSLMTLAETFRCCEMDIFDALYELRQQAYVFEINGLDNPIKLWDPLRRQPTNLNRLQALTQGLLRSKPETDQTVVGRVRSCFPNAIQRHQTR